MKSSAKKVELASVDDLFSTEESRADAQREKVLEIPHSVRAKEISAEGKSIFAHDPGGKVAEGYRNLTKEVLKLEKQREKSRAGIGR